VVVRVLHEAFAEECLHQWRTADIAGRYVGDHSAQQGCENQWAVSTRAAAERCLGVRKYVFVVGLLGVLILKRRVEVLSIGPDNYQSEHLFDPP
jgi:hypothetical protein